jgi:hypothetical protein
MHLGNLSLRTTSRGIPDATPLHRIECQRVPASAVGGGGGESGNAVDQVHDLADGRHLGALGRRPTDRIAQ